MDTKLKLRNPILAKGADPWVIRKDGTYIYTHTTQHNITVWKSDTLSGIGSGEGKVVWTPPESGPQSRNLWAPEIHDIDGRYYIYYAADDGRNENHRMFVLESVGDDAFGPYVNRGQITDAANKWAIDGTVLRIGEAMYFIWSGWEGDTDVRQDLYIVPMSNPWTISGDRVEISRPDRPWEQIGEPHVNEGPVTLIRNNRIFLIYSASGSWTDDYCLGMLSASLDDDPLRPESWKKHDRPVFARTDAVFGPGHNSFAKSPDGSEDWIVYHAAVAQGSGWNRNVRMQPFTWNEDGTPNFGAPADPATALRLPSGE